MPAGERQFVRTSTCIAAVLLAAAPAAGCSSTAVDCEMSVPTMMFLFDGTFDWLRVDEATVAPTDESDLTDLQKGLADDASGPMVALATSRFEVLVGQPPATLLMADEEASAVVDALEDGDTVYAAVEDETAGGSLLIADSSGSLRFADACESSAFGDQLDVLTEVAATAPGSGGAPTEEEVLLLLIAESQDRDPQDPPTGLLRELEERLG